MLTIDVITIFPKFFTVISEFGVVREGLDKNLFALNFHDLRDFSKDRHRKVDDRPYGGGPGMVLSVQPIDDAVTFIRNKRSIKKSDSQKVVLLSPAGIKLNQGLLKGLSLLENIILICGRYEGVDERVKTLAADMEISIGDFILTGGEIPAMVIIDGIARLIEGVVGNCLSIEYESFQNNLLDYPHYTRPEIYRDLKVPDVLLGGNHKEIEKWRKEMSEEITRKNRPDLIDK
jgi:tRNA (guanine37-N1)-methyltransferase